MRIKTLVCLVTLCGAFPAGAQTTSRQDVERAIAAVHPSLVRIAVVAVEHAHGREVRREVSGSGTIVSADGYVVTNHHVAGRGRRILCALSDNQEIPADLVGTDPLSDIAVLKLRPAMPRTFPAARFGDSSGLVRGEPILALGSPLALSQSVTLGIVSNPEMVMPRAMGGGPSLDGEDVGSIVRWIGHDAAIYPGNSGGPLVNVKGEVVGINEISFGLAGAIPASVARPVTDALIKEGRVRRGWMGAELQPTLRGDRRAGALVAWVADGSPAAAAGLRSGDLLVRINETPVDLKYPEQLPTVNQVVAALPPGRPARLALVRGTASLALSLIPVERAAAEGTRVELRDWGMVAANLTPVASREIGRATTDGIGIVDVRSGGAADQAKPPLQRGDVLVAVDGTPVHSVADVEGTTRTLLRAGSGVRALVAFDRGLERWLSVVELTSRRTDPPVAEARKASLPVAVQVLTPVIAERLGLAGRSGVRVTQVMDAASPLRVGDIVLAIDGADVPASSPNDGEVFASLLRRHAVGMSVTLTVHREAAVIQVTTRLGAAPPLPREMPRHDDLEFGFRAREVASQDLRDPRLRGLSGGVVVEAVEEGGWAALARLAVGDVILAVEGVPVTGAEDLAGRLKVASAARRSPVVVQVRRGVRTVFIALEPVWER